METAICSSSSPAVQSAAIGELLRRIRPRVKRLLKGYGMPFQDFEDLLQEALLDALRQWETIHNLEAWLLGTLRIKCLRYWRRQGIERVFAVDSTELESLCEPQSPAQEQAEFRLDARNLTRGLSRRHRAALWLRFGLGMSSHEVARRLGYSPASIRKLCSRARAQVLLTEAMGGLADDPETQPTAAVGRTGGAGL